MQVNAPPSGGSCTACLTPRTTGVCGKYGLALLDTFELSCTGWADSDLPLQYRFGYRPIGNFTDVDTWFAWQTDASVILRLASGTYETLYVVSSLPVLIFSA